MMEPRQSVGQAGGLFDDASRKHDRDRRGERVTVKRMVIHDQNGCNPLRRSQVYSAIHDKSSLHEAYRVCHVLQGPPSAPEPRRSSAHDAATAPSARRLSGPPEHRGPSRPTPEFSRDWRREKDPPPFFQATGRLEQSSAKLSCVPQCVSDLCGLRPCRAA